MEGGRYLLPLRVEVCVSCGGPKESTGPVSRAAAVGLGVPAKEEIAFPCGSHVRKANRLVFIDRLGSWDVLGGRPARVVGVIGESVLHPLPLGVDGEVGIERAYRLAGLVS